MKRTTRNIGAAALLAIGALAGLAIVGTTTQIPCTGDAAACARVSVAVQDPPPPIPTDPTTDAVCTDNGWQTTMTSACVGGFMSVTKAHTWTQVTPPGGTPPGKSCPLTVTTTDTKVPCTPPPIPDPTLPGPFGGFTTARLMQSTIPPAPGDGIGAFRTIIGPSHFSYNDPLVFPRQRGASHCHSFFGNTSTDENSTPASMMAAPASTARGGTLNKTAYWFPCLKDANGKIVVPSYLQAYYKSGYNQIPIKSIEAIQPGLAFIAGNRPTDTGPGPYSEFVYFECYPSGYPTRQAYIVPCNAGPGAYLMAVVMGPNCWDGVNKDSPDHRAHMAYSYGGTCPASHPHPIPTISLNVVYPIATNTNGWKFASDTAPGVGGYSFHADYWGFWDPATEDIWLNNCVKKPADCHTDLIGDVAAFPPNGRTVF